MGGMSGALHTAKAVQVFPRVLREVPPISGKTTVHAHTCGQVVAPADPIKKIAMRGQAVSLSVEALDREGEACLRPVDSLGCELVSSDGSSRVRGSVKRRDKSRYDIICKPQHIGRHQLDILIK